MINLFLSHLRRTGSVAEKKTLDKLELMKTLLLLIPTGKVVSYKDLAISLGIHPRAAGKLLARNDEPVVIPCHRVVRSDGKLGGYSGKGGIGFKKKLLELEGVSIRGGIVDRKSFFSLAEFLGLEDS
jgi:methylated-DNA-[protein]-cysteine S-methyltransferase